MPTASDLPLHGLEILPETIDELLAVRAEAGAISRAELLARLSGHLLGTPYGPNMLIGSATEPEQLVIDLRRVDWKVWGRQDRLYVKEFEEETNLRLRHHTLHRELAVEAGLGYAM